ncbi:MAG TPA: type III-A CRISPR-associated protein Csm2 [Candidatus Eisenbacteria bacterium]|nr:type III-A CRISPR-associated protein Csm2 [Candidatus Eisenbacteria bacterium]
MKQPPTDQRNRKNPAEGRQPRAQFAGIRFAKPLDAELFNTTALQAAKDVAQNNRSNKLSQLRKFYDELLMWETRVAQRPDRFDEYLPLIRMLNAKVAYAEGRKLVDAVFVDLMRHTLNEVKNPETLTTCKLFWEAFMGFYKKEAKSE